MRRDVMTKAFFVVFIVILFLEGCATTGSPFSKISPMEEGKGLIYLYHPYRYEGIVGSSVANGFDMSINNNFLVNVSNGGYYPIFLVPGTYTFSVPFNRQKIELKIDIQVGETYYIKCEVESSGGYYADGTTIIGHQSKKYPKLLL